MAEPIDIVLLTFNRLDYLIATVDNLEARTTQPYRLTIVDNGCGFIPEERDPAPATGEHLGLLTMRERAARLRGKLALISSPGVGTTIEAAVPMAAE